MGNQILPHEMTYLGTQHFKGGVEIEKSYVNNLAEHIKGKVFYVDPQYGSNGYSGTTPSTAKATLAQAYTLCESGRGDVIYVLSSGTSSANTTSYLSTSLDWSKWGITVIGKCSGSWISQRSRISNTTTVLNLPYLIDVQGSNNAFYNVSLFNSGSNALAVGALTVSGERNLFVNCHAVGGGHATPAAVVGKESLHLTGSENSFYGCTFGTDTIDNVGDLVSCEILLSGGGARNLFDHCRTLSQTSSTNTAKGAIKGAAGDCITRDIIFQDCLFINWKAVVLTNPLASVFVGTGPNNGNLVFMHCGTVGYALYDAATGNDRAIVIGPVTAANSGVGVYAS